MKQKLEALYRPSNIVVYNVPALLYTLKSTCNISAQKYSGFEWGTCRLN